MEQIWNSFGSSFYKGDDAGIQKRLPSGVFIVAFDNKIGCLYLEKVADQFHFPYKLYNISEKFINRVVKTYENTSSNLGVLLNGIKGTGKTVTGEIIANKINLPVILVTKNFEKANLAEFLQGIQQEILVFIDEYEKIFEKSSHMLSLMDGVMNSTFRKVFILTTNNKYVDDNLLQRPGRIRYLKDFNLMPEHEIEMIVDDLLLYPEYKKDMLKVFSELDIVTVDLVKSFVQEINIHNESPEILAKDFNFKKKKAEIVKFYLVNEDKTITKFLKDGASNFSQYLHRLQPGDSFYLPGLDSSIGTVVSKSPDNTHALISLNTNRQYTGIEYLDKDLEPEDPTEKISNYYSYGNALTPRTVIIKIEEETASYSTKLAF